MDYLDFRLKIGPRVSDNQYTVSARSPSMGESEGVFTRPLTDEQLELFVLKVGLARRGVRRIRSPEWRAAQDFGQKLFRALFTEEIRASYLASHNDAVRQGKGLRIQLTLDAPELANYPWEFLYDPSNGQFLSLFEDTPILRYIELTRPILPLLVTPPLRILAVASGPQDYPTLDLAQERQNLSRALAPLLASGLMELDWLETATLESLREQLLKRSYHIFHFIGHGGFDEGQQDGVVIFENAVQYSNRVSGERLAVILGNHRTLRLTILNACEGARTSEQDPFAGTAMTLVRTGNMPAVIAMQFEISDTAAIDFASGFYSAIAVGKPVDSAVNQGRQAIFANDNDVEWSTPVLYLRAPDGIIFNVDASQSAELAKQQAAAQALLEQQRIEQEHIAQEKVKAERAAAELAENERREKERLEQERVAQEKVEAERVAAEQAENQRREQERLEQERVAQEKVEQERVAAEQAETERRENARLEQERLAQEKLEQERAAAEQAENQRRENARLEQKRIAQEKLQAERAAFEKPQEQPSEVARMERARLALEARKAEQAAQKIAPSPTPAVVPSSTISVAQVKTAPAETPTTSFVSRIQALPALILFVLSGLVLAISSNFAGTSSLALTYSTDGYPTLRLAGLALSGLSLLIALLGVWLLATAIARLTASPFDSTMILALGWLAAVLLKLLPGILFSNLLAEYVVLGLLVGGATAFALWTNNRAIPSQQLLIIGAAWLLGFILHALALQPAIDSFSDTLWEWLAPLQDSVGIYPLLAIEFAIFSFFYSFIPPLIGISVMYLELRRPSAQ